MKYLFTILFFWIITFHISAQWHSLNVGTQEDLLSLSFPGQDTAFLSSGYDLWRTTDSGNSWLVVDTPDNRHESLYQVCFTSAKTGCIGTINGIMKTTDGGQTWKENDFDSGHVIISIYFLNDSLGFAEDGSNIFITLNGGNSWIKKNSVMGFQVPSHITFITANEGFMTGIEYPLYKFTDTCKNIIPLRLRFPQTVNRAYFLSPSEGYICGYHPVLEHSSDSGNTWQESDSGLNINLHYYDVHFINSDTGYTCGDSGAIYLTTNGGKYWVKQNSGTTETLSQFAFLSDSNIYVIGNGGILLHTTNGGAAKHNSFIHQIEPGLSDITIYPNPTSGNVVIETDGQQGTLQYRLYNSTGQFLIAGTIVSGRTSSALNIDNCPPGIYFLKVQSCSGLITEKIEMVR